MLANVRIMFYLCSVNMFYNLNLIRMKRKNAKFAAKRVVVGTWVYSQDKYL